MRKHLFLILCAVVVPWSASAERLSDVDVELLMEKLKDLRDGEKGRRGGRLGTAKGAFDRALRDDDLAHELFLMCVEKVRFEDEQKKTQDFRDWKRRHKEREDSPEFRRALRHQLNWLTLTMEASEAEDIGELGEKAMARLDALVADAEHLKGQKKLLEEDVLKSVFAAAYRLGGTEIENWPLAPLKVEEIYEKVVLPPLRNPKKLKELRAAWIKRIQQEGHMVEEWSQANGRDRDAPSADMTRFITEKRPQMQWAMEVDLFKAGDQKASALRMLKHIENNFGHQSEGKWIAEFEALVSGRGETGEATVTAGE